LVLDAAEAELALRLQGQAADRQQDPPASVPVPVWLELMNLFSNDAPMLVRHTVWCMRQKLATSLTMMIPRCIKRTH
jgi:hypothetical protein